MNSNMIQTVTLRFPIQFEGRAIESLEVDLSKLTGEAFGKTATRYTSEGHGDASPVSLDFCAYCASVCAEVPTELMGKLIGPDYCEAALLVQNFLLDTPWIKELLAAEPEKSDDAA
ncbi:MAG: hypothetical protein ABFD49_11825 [Armatimonadota bacterium]|nr:phage tail assembly protein [bacterium]